MQREKTVLMLLFCAFIMFIPCDTKVKFRYDLETVNEMGDTIMLPDIYKRGKQKQPVRAVIGVYP